MESLLEQTWPALGPRTLQENGNLQSMFSRELFELEVLALHEDLVTGLRAKHLLRKLEDQLELRIAVQTDWCRFDLLADAELAEATLNQARKSSIVVLSLHGDQPLSRTLRGWLLRWLETREFKPCALVALLDAKGAQAEKSNAIYNFLNTITAPLEIDFFCIWGGSGWLTK